MSFLKAAKGLARSYQLPSSPLDEELPEDIPTVLEFRANAPET